MDTQPIPAVDLVYRNLLIGGEPGSGKSGLLKLLAAREALAGSTCLACPAGRAECSHDGNTCECYRHPHPHPGNEPDTGPGVA